MVIKNSLILVLFITMFSLYGCSVEKPQIQNDTNDSNPNQEFIEEPTEKNPHFDNNESDDTNNTKDLRKIISAGDEQNVLENSEINLMMSILVDDINLTKFYWKQNNEIISHEKNCTIKNIAIGTYTFVAYAQDDLNNTYSDSVNVYVKKPSDTNHAPEAEDVLFSLNEDTIFKGSLNGFDEDGDELDFLLVSFPKYGKLSGSAARLVYTPKKDFYGKDEFLYKINDGKIDSNIAKVSINVKAVNDTPITYSDEINITEDSQNELIILNSYDVDDDNLTFSIYNLPINGNVTYSGNTAYYTPNKDFNGDDSFYFGVNDGLKDSNLAKIIIHVIPTNDLPIAYDKSIVLQEDNKDFNITLDAYDIDGDTLTYKIDLAPTNGKIDINGSLVRYTPNPNFYGNDSFTFFVNDGLLNSNKATVDINVTAVNDAPISYEQNITIYEDSKDNLITLHASDLDDTNLSFKRVALPLHGSVYFQDSTVLYTPEKDFYGDDFFSFVANDSKVNSNVSKVYIKVLNTNEESTDINLSKLDIDENSDKDTVIGEFFTQDEDQETGHIYTFVGNDNDNGFFNISQNRLLLDFKPDFETPQDLDHDNTYHLKIQSEDNNNSTIIKEFDIQINDLNEAPFFIMDSNITVNENQTYVTTLKANDYDSDTILSYSLIDSNTTFNLDEQSGKLSFKYPPNFEDNNNTYTINVRVSDGELNSDLKLNIDVLNVNEKPTLSDYSLIIEENSYIGKIVIDLNASDVDSNDLTYSIISGNTNNSFSINDLGEVKVTNLLDFESDTNSFNLGIKVSDDEGLSDDSILKIDLKDVNEAPSFDDKNVSIREDISNDDEVTRLSASDPENDTLSFSIISGDDDGIFILDDHILKIADNTNIDYESTKFYNLNIKVSDLAGLEDNATIHIIINDASEAPSIDNATFSLDENSPIGTLVGVNQGSDPDGDTLTYSIDSDTFNVDNNGTITLVKNVNFEEKNLYEPTITVSDGNFSDSATIIININDLNEAPSLSAKTLNLDENATNGTILGQMIGNDVDFNDSIKYSFASSNSIFSIDEDSAQISLIDKDQIDYESVNSYTYNVNATDNDGLYAQALLTINVNNINESPTIYDANFSIDENITNNSIVGVVNSSDPENDNLTYSIVSDNFGIFDIDDENASIYIYDNSQIDYEKRTSYPLEVEVNDNNGHLQSANIIINVNNINETPIIESNSTSLDENATNGTIIFNINANDPENKSLRFEIVNLNSDIFSIDTNHLILNNNSLLNYENKDSYDFDIKVYDDINQSDIAPFHIDINDINEAPRLESGVYSINENSPDGTSISLAQPGDEDIGDSVTYTILSGDDDEIFGIREDGVIEIFDSTNLDYESKSTYDLLIKADDGELSSQINITINITNIDEKPVVTDLTAITDEDTSIDITLEGIDEEGESLIFEIDSNASHGLVELNNNIVTYTPNLNYNGSDSFTYVAKDTNNTSEPATVTININDINDKPIISQINQQTIQEDNNITITLSALDVDGEIVSYEAFDESNATIIINSNELTFIPDPNFNGLSEFKYRAKDDDGDYSDTLTMQINVNAINDKPIGINDNITTNEDTQITFNPLTNDTDIENDTLSISSITNPEHGSIEVNETVITYIPSENYHGTDNFTYIPNDGSDDGEETTVYITITSVNDAPIARAKISDTNVSIGTYLIFSDDESSDVDGDNLSFEWWEGNLLLSIDSNFTKRNLSIGDHHIAFIVRDGHGGEDRVYLDVSVNDIDVNFTQLQIPDSESWSWISFSDLDNDNDLDIISVDSHTDPETSQGKRVLWMENVGNGNNFIRHDLPDMDIDGINVVKSADMDNDGYMDIVYSSTNHNENIIICKNNKNKTFDCQTAINVSDNSDETIFFDIADIDNDKKLDIIFSEDNNDNLYWLKNLGDSNFDIKKIVDNSDDYDSKYITTFDFNKDGNIEIFATSVFDDTIYMYEYNLSNSSFKKTKLDDTIRYVRSITHADLNGDGYEDIIIASEDNHKVYWLKNLYHDSTSSYFDTPKEIAQLDNSIYYASGIDIDNDGDMDILTSDLDNSGYLPSYDSNAVWYENINADGLTWQKHYIDQNTRHIRRLFASDIDNDNIMDIFAMKYENDSNITLYTNNYPTITPLMEKADNNSFGEYNTYHKDAATTIVRNERTKRQWADEDVLVEDDTQHCTNLDFGGYQDWRLPTIWESFYLANPFTNTNAVENGFNSISTDYSTYIMSDINISIDISSKTISDESPVKVLCTRGVTRDFKYIRDDLNESIYDPTYELYWDDNNNSISTADNFEDANQFCINKNMRVPNINELLSIYDNNTSSKFNKAFKEYKNDGNFWSSSIKNGDYIKFDFINNKTITSYDTPIYIRCVKSINKN